MLGTIKNYLIVILAGGLLFCFGLLQMARAGRAKDKLKAQEKVGEVMAKAIKAIQDGRKRKEKSRASDDSDMRHFGDD